MSAMPKDLDECRRDYEAAFPGRVYPGYAEAFRQIRIETARRLAAREPMPWVQQSREPGEDDDETEAHWTDR